ncbi:dehydrogenase [Bradyrhizobium diazoefficiens]|uniref:Dehydrogenase n=1 Tax=Bradyrhizobium diazoefficiens TaxID=1355477 RepID=A0A0E4BKP0_9BRAD|nr:dehydrogenase [Bradyrhizobium diazoefficiens]
MPQVRQGLLMTFSSIFAQFVALLGGIALQWRKLSGTEPAPAWGQTPAIPEAKPQGAIPTLKMPTARGWSEGQKPTVAPGLKVNAFATGLDHPRWIEVLPNGDVLIAEATQIAGPPRSVFHYAMQATMRRAAALGVSANRITLLRDKDGDGVAEVRGAFMENLSQPFGMALVGDTFYVGNTDGVMAFPYVANADRITAPGKRLTTFKPSGHWTRSLLASPDGRKLYAGVGSLSNIAEMGMEVEEGRAAVYELDLAAGTHRILVPACATQWALPGSQRPACSGPSSTSATGSATRRRRTISPRCVTAASMAGPIATGARRWTTACRRIRQWSPRRSRRTMRSAATPLRSACAGCPQARCRVSPTAW